MPITERRQPAPTTLPTHAAHYPTLLTMRKASRAKTREIGENLVVKKFFPFKYPGGGYLCQLVNKSDSFFLSIG
jgi:hypothetical protein